jgi:hypothetical protein
MHRARCAVGVMSAWRGPQRVLLGVSGGIAAYKACELVRRLREHDVEVRVVLTANAERFVGALTFQALSGQPVRNSLWDAAAEAAMGHIELARWADVVLVAPASANTLARLAHGLADDLLGTLCLASDRPPAAGTGNEPLDVGAPGDAGQFGFAAGARRADSGSGQRRAGLWRGRHGAHAGTGCHRHGAG